MQTLLSSVHSENVYELNYIVLIIFVNTTLDNFTGVLKPNGFRLVPERKENDQKTLIPSGFGRKLKSGSPSVGKY